MAGWSQSFNDHMNRYKDAEREQMNRGASTKSVWPKRKNRFGSEKEARKSWNAGERKQQQLDALRRAEDGETATNYPAIYSGFVAKGIAESDIRPRENVFTFNAWKAKGRSVKKGEHGVRVVTFIEKTDPDTGKVDKRPWTTVVFHISQTEPTADAEARWKAKRAFAETGKLAAKREAEDAAAVRAAYGKPEANAPEPIIRDPGEDAADRWQETHGDRWIED